MAQSKRLEKSADAFRTISEAALEIGVPQHVLRHWEEAFGQIRPMRRAGGRRYYRPFDLDVLRGVKALLYDQRYTTRGVQKIFKVNGVRFVGEVGRRAAAGKPVDLRPPSDDSERETRALAAVLPDDPDLRERLTALLARLERVQNTLDEAITALEAAKAAQGDGLGDRTP